jgi:tetratricopeptide (TPR) repeat protein
MKTTVKTIVVIFIFWQNGFSQSPLTPGFQMLENGKFDEAVGFFQNYLKTDSSNPTALLCYGRGLGLTGRADKALEIFYSLRQASPGSFEVDINIAEAFMWSKDFTTAKNNYHALLQRDSSSFSANLGLANAYSELQKYDSALVFVQKALILQPTNGNAQVSRKFMRLGKSSQLVGKGNFKEALKYLSAILEEAPTDVDGLQNIANLYAIMGEYNLALAKYESLLSVPSKRVDGAIGISQVKFQQKKAKEALNWAQKAHSMADSLEYVKTKIAVINALGWNKDFKGANLEISKLEASHPSSKEDILAAQGRIGIWSKSFKKGAQAYMDLMKISAKSFEGNLGYADAHHAMGLDNKSFEYVRKTLQYYPGQLDASGFLDRLYAGHDPTLINNLFFSQDNGRNASRNIYTRLNIDPGPLTKTFVAFYQRDVFNISNKENNTVVNSFSTGISHRQNEIVKYGVSAGMIQGSNLKRFMAELNSEWKLGKYHSAELNYKEEIQTFNAELISQNLKQQNLNLNYNLFLPSKIGLYSQIIHTRMSDDNSRSLIFSSLYYLLTDSPIIKMGFNYGGFGFKRQVPQVYFSPDRFRSYEVFTASENTNNTKAKIFYQSTIGFGFQQISKEKLQQIYRFDVKVGTKFLKSGLAMVYFMRSNSAASSVQGFTYNEWGLNLKYIIRKHTF